MQVDAQLVLGVRRRAPEQFFHDVFLKRDGEQAILEAIVEEYVRKTWCNHGAHAVIAEQMANFYRDHDWL